MVNSADFLFKKAFSHLERHDLGRLGVRVLDLLQFDLFLNSLEFLNQELPLLVESFLFPFLFICNFPGFNLLFQLSFFINLNITDDQQITFGVSLCRPWEHYRLSC